MTDGEKKRHRVTLKEILHREGFFETGDIDEMNMRDLTVYMDMSEEDRNEIPDAARAELEKHAQIMGRMNERTSTAVARLAETFKPLRVELPKISTPIPPLDPSSLLLKQPTSTRSALLDERTVQLSQADRDLLVDIRDLLRVLVERKESE